MDVPGSGDDEYRSTVFDESFVKAARIQEYSARERMRGTARAVRPRHPWVAAGGRWQAVALVLLIVAAFGASIYMGVRHPYRPAEPAGGVLLHVTLVPLAPTAPVPAASADPLYAADHGSRYQEGAAGITLPAVRATAHFTVDEVLEALTIAKEYLVDSSLEADSFPDGDVRDVRDLLDPGEYQQFDRSLARPADDGEHAATGWLVRFDPARVALADPGIRVQGTMAVGEHGPDALEVSTDHTLVYSVRAAGGGPGQPSLFTVRRQLVLYFDRADLNAHQVEVEQAAVEAGPLACTGDVAGYFRPLLAGQGAPAGAGIDPYDRGTAVAPTCGLLRTAAASRAPDPPASRRPPSPAGASRTR
jgi:hypothetical protein